MPIEVQGLKPALQTLNKLEPELRKQFTKDIRKIAEPALAEIRALIPVGAPLSGMAHNGRTGWTGNEQSYVKVLQNAKKPKLKKTNTGSFVSNLAVIVISAATPKTAEKKRGAAMLIADMAGAGKGSPRNARRARPNLPGALNASVGHAASRFMWPGATRGIPLVIDEITAAAEVIVKQANYAIGRGK